MDVKVAPSLCVLVIFVVDTVLSEENVGKWTTWSSWSECTHSCGSGIITRARYWEQPPGEPKFEKPYTMTENMECNEGNCPVDGSWHMWGQWSPCSEACGGGVAIRKRTCNDPMHGGKPCEGENYEEDECNDVSCPPLPVRFNISACSQKRHFMCSSRRMCIPMDELCDNTVQCHDGSDEKRCYDADSESKVRYSYVRDAGETIRATLTIVTSFVAMAIMTSLLD